MDFVSIANNELEFGDEIGSGGEGSVYKGKWRLFKNGMEEIQDVAIKRLLTSTDLSELQTLSGLSHPNIINVYGFVKEHHELCIVMELCQYSLRCYIERNPSPLSDEHLLRWSLEAALPLEYLRKHNILHRDVKPENYVVDSGMVLKLTDFGVARKLDCTVSNFTHVGTWRWMAPEVHGVEDNRLLLSPSYDIFALGLVLWYLVGRKMPYGEFESHNHYAITTAIINGKRPVIPAKCPVKLAELIQKCWSGDRKDRPNISQVILLIKDVIASLETTGTLLRIEDMASVETTGDDIRRLMRPISNPTDKKMTDTNPVAVFETPDNANLGAAAWPLADFSPKRPLPTIADGTPVAEANPADKILKRKGDELDKLRVEYIRLLESREANSGEADLIEHCAEVICNARFALAHAVASFQRRWYDEPKHDKREMEFSLFKAGPNIKGKEVEKGGQIIVVTTLKEAVQEKLKKQLEGRAVGEKQWKMPEFSRRFPDLFEYYTSIQPALNPDGSYDWLAALHYLTNRHKHEPLSQLEYDVSVKQDHNNVHITRTFNIQELAQTARFGVEKIVFEFKNADDIDRLAE